MLNEKMHALVSGGSPIRDIADYAEARAAVIGEDNVFNFSIGNPYTPAPKEVNETLIDLLEHTGSVTLHSYTPDQGLMSTRSAAAKVESERAGYDIPGDCVYMTAGASASLAIVLAALTRPGEKVAVLAPFFTEYRVFIENAGAEVVVIPPAGVDMQPEMSAFKKAVEDGLAAVIINSPNNPSGAILSEETLAAMADILREAEKKQGKTIYLIADEPYRELVYTDAKVPFVPNIYNNTVVCYSYSKSLSLPGERLGYIMVPPCVDDSKTVYATVCGAGRSLGYVCAPSLMQRMLVRCANLKPDLSGYKKNRDTLYNALTAMGFECVKPDGAFYLFLKAPKGDSAAEFCAKAKKYEILLVGSDPFGVPGYARLAYCVSEKTVNNSLPAFKKLAEEYGL